MSARVHPGRVVHVWDHYVITLRDGAAEHVVSLYDVSHSPELGSGRVCVVRTPTEPARLYADDADLGVAMARRLSALPGSDDDDVPDDARPATFRREALAGGFRWLVEGDGSGVEARWLATRPAIWVEGPAPAFWDREDIWACFVEADDAAIRLDGMDVGGTTYPQDAWLPKIGRRLSSAHVAFAEVRVTPVDAEA